VKRVHHGALCGFHFVVDRESRAHTLQRFLTVADPRLCDSPVRPDCARFGRRKRQFGGLLDLDEVAPFALTASDTQIIGASAKAVEMVWARRDRKIVQTQAQGGEVTRLNLAIEIRSRLARGNSK
jgi:hypothetical protein